MHHTNRNNIRNFCDHIVCEDPVRRLSPINHLYFSIYLLLIARYHHVGASYFTLPMLAFERRCTHLRYSAFHTRPFLHEPVLMSVNRVFQEKYNQGRRKLIIEILITGTQYTVYVLNIPLFVNITTVHTFLVTLRKRIYSNAFFYSMLFRKSAHDFSAVFFFHSQTRLS